MGSVFSSPGVRERRKYMKSPELDVQAPEIIAELVSELGRHPYAGIVSIGPVGVGKSSNLNTIASYMTNKLEQQAASGSGASSLTHQRRTHIISYQGRPVRWKWMDTPGDLFTDLVEKWKETQIADSSLRSPMSAYEEHLRETLITPMLSHQIGCVMAFLSASDLAANTMSVDRGGAIGLRVVSDSRTMYTLRVLKDLYRRLVQSGLRMVAILTKMDIVDAAVEEDVAEVQYSEAVNQLRECVARETGMPMNQVHVVVNLVADFSPMDNFPLGILALFNVRCALAAALHSDSGPQHPDSVRHPEWDTLTYPSAITGDDGVSGRSHVVREGEARVPSVAHVPDDANSISCSQFTDIDETLLQSARGRGNAGNGVDDDADSSFQVKV